MGVRRRDVRHPYGFEVGVHVRAGRHRPLLSSVIKREDPGACNEMSSWTGGAWMSELEGGYEAPHGSLMQEERGR